MTAFDEKGAPAGHAEQAQARPSGFFANRWVRIGLALLGVLVLLGLALRWLRPPELHGIALQSPDRAADFTLTASTGEPMSLSDFRGKYVLLYFGYTFCPDVCPTTMNDLRTAVRTLGDKADDVQVIMVSVDPQRDTVEQMAKYVAAFDPSFLGMTGDQAVIDQAASQFGVFFDVHEGSAATGYLVDHTSIVTLIDPEGYAREIFAYGTSGEEIAADVAQWMR
ncbi:MAG: SCO family protein [Caldilineaceae bacterium]|nr:SCO family protein [Caldilineaceae bacterium]